MTLSSLFTGPLEEEGLARGLILFQILVASTASTALLDKWMGEYE